MSESPPEANEEPTFACTWTGCTKAYHRRDHLERHIRTHSGEGRLTCHLCFKQYIRSDILTRHLVKSHGLPAPSVGRPRKYPCASCKAKRRYSDAPPSPCARCANIKDPPTSSQTQAQEREANPGAIPVDFQQTFLDTFTFPPPLPTVPEAVNEQTAYVSPGLQQCLPLLSPALTMSLPPQDNSLDFFAATAPRLDPSPNWMQNFLSSATTDHLFDESFDTSFAGTSAPPHAEWGFTDVFDVDIFEALGTHALGSPERDADLVMGVEPEEVDGRSNVRELPDGQPQHSSWPNIYKPSTPEWQLALPHTPLSDSVVPTFLAPGPQVHGRARNIMSTLIQHAHRAVWPLPDLGDFPSNHSLTQCVNLYLGHFAAWLPVVDCPRGSFRIDKAAPLLLMSMAAIGAVYERGELAKLGLPLNELVRRVIVFICEHDRRFAFQTGVVQSALLQAYFGIYSGSPKLFQQAEVTRAFLVGAAKRMSLLRRGGLALQELKRTQSDPTPDQVVSAEKQDDRMLRLGWTIYIFDAQLACLLEVPSQYPLFEVLAPLAGDKRAQPFPEVMTALLDSGRLPENINDFGLSIIAYTLYRQVRFGASIDGRLCLDSAATQFGSSTPGFHKYNLDFGRHRHHPQILLDNLARHCFASAHSPTSLLTSCICLAHHSHLQFTRVGFLNDVMAAAGKLGTDVSKEVAQASLTRWIGDNPKAARNITGHAAVLVCLLDRFKFDTPVEVVWLFHSSLCLWACLKFSQEPFPQVSLESSTSISISWSTASELDDWVEKGGRMTVQGLGDVGRASLNDILHLLSARLETVSWGMADRYRTVLLDLLGGPTVSVRRSIVS